MVQRRRGLQPRRGAAAGHLRPADVPRRVEELRGDPINNVDLSVIKNTTILNGKVLQLRLEALNAFNHPLFAVPNLTPTAAAFGQASAQNNYARRMQAMVKFLF